MATLLDDDLWVCVDCMIVAVNGDYSGLTDERCEEVDAGLEGTGGYVVPNFDGSETDDGIREFSWSPCHCCGSELGGSRHRMAVLA